MFKAIRPGLLLGLIPALAVAQSVHCGRLRSLTADEGLALHQVSQSLHHGTSALLHEIHTPLYNFLLAGWSVILGAEASSAKLLSAMMAALSVLLTFLFARRRLGGRTAAIAALLLASAPLHVYYSQSIRTYALLIAMATLSSHAYLGYCERPGRKSGTYYLLATALMVYSHLTGFGIVIAQWIHFLWFGARPDRVRRIPAWLGLQSLLILLYSPVLVVLLTRFDLVRDIPYYYSWVRMPALGDLAIHLADLPGQNPRHELAFLYAVPVVFAAMFARKSPPSPGSPQDDAHAHAYLWLWYLVPGVTVYLYARVHSPVPLLRAIVPSIVPVTVLAASGLAGMSRRWRSSWILLSVMLLVSLRITLQQWTWDREGWFGLESRLQPGNSDIVLVWPSILMHSYAYYEAPECFGSPRLEECLNSKQVHPFDTFDRIEGKLSPGATVWLIGHTPGISPESGGAEILRLLKTTPDYTEAVREKKISQGLGAVRFTVPGQMSPLRGIDPFRTRK